MQTTGCYASNLLGKDERQHRTLAEMVTSMLYSSNLPAKYWCFAVMYSIWIKRRVYTYPDSKTPFEKWFGSKPEFRDAHIFGAPVTITNENSSKEQPRNRLGRFLGLSSYSAVIIYEDLKTKKIKRARNCRIGNYFSLALTNSSLDCPASRLIHATSNKQPLPTLSQDLPLLEYVPSPFASHDLFTYEITVPLAGPFGITLQDDEFFGLPIIIDMSSDSYFVKGCKKSLRRQVWIINVHHDEPITASRVIEYINYLRKNQIFTFNVTLCKRMTTQRTNYEEFRLRFDNIRPIVSRAAVRLKDTDSGAEYFGISPAAKYAVYSNTKPSAPNTWTDLKADHLREYWIKGMYERYLHNYNAGLWSAPTPRKLLPPNAVILRLVSVFKVKSTDVPNIWDLYYRPCANGGPMEQGIHYSQSYCLTSGYAALRLILCLSSVLYLTVYMFDVHNAFQCTPLPENDTSPPIHVTLPPLYIQWFLKAHPNFKLDVNEKYVLQMFMNMQGNKQTNRGFYQLLSKIFATIELYPLSADNAIFAMIKDTQILILAVQTDDTLVATNAPSLKDKVLSTLQQAFKVTTQEGIKLKYLNFRIIQSTHGISIDQTDHILELVNSYIPVDTKVEPANTPLRSDRQFQDEVSNSVPSSPGDLKKLEKEFGYKFSSLYGALLDVSSSSRPDLSNAINRLGIFQAGPNRLAFESLHRCLRYLKTHPNVPLMYSRKPFDSSTIFQFHFSKATPDSHLRVPHCICGHVDSSFAPYKENRHSITGCIETMGSTAISWKTTKQIACATSATEAETRAYYLECKRINKLHLLLQQIGIRLKDACPVLANFNANLKFPTPIFEDNKGTRDMIDARQVTTNLRHVDIPLHYVHELHENGVVTCLPCSSEHMFDVH